MTLPNFFIVGTAKSGTTAVNEYLQQHPQIYMSPRKEPFYFILDGQPLAYNGPGDRETLARLVVNDAAAYAVLFDGVADEIAIGEATTQYLYVEPAAARIQAAVPSAKIVIFLRHPVARAYSSYMHMLRDEREPCEDFEAALDQEPERIAANWEPLWHYSRASYYAESIQRYYRLFGREQVAVFLQEDLKADAAGLLRAICDFLEVDASFTFDTETRYNVSGVPKNKMLHAVQNALLDPDNRVKALVKPLLPQRLRHRALHGVVGKMRAVNFEQRSLEPELRARLLEDYRDDILATQALIGRDLSHWLV